MSFLALDESGDPNFRCGTRHFVVAGIVIGSRKQFKATINELIEEYPCYFKSKKFHKIEIKFSLLKDDEIIYFLDGIKDLNYSAFCTCLDTYNPPAFLEKDGMDISCRKTLLAGITIANALEVHEIRKIEIDKGALSEKALRKLQRKIKERYLNPPKIRARPSHNSQEIQMADLIAGSVRKYLKGEDKFFPYVKDKLTKIDIKG